MRFKTIALVGLAILCVGIPAGAEGDDEREEPAQVTV